MKKHLLLLACVPLLFASCESEINGGHPEEPETSEWIDSNVLFDKPLEIIYYSTNQEMDVLLEFSYDEQNRLSGRKVTEGRNLVEESENYEYKDNTVSYDLQFYAFIGGPVPKTFKCVEQYEDATLTKLVKKTRASSATNSEEIEYVYDDADNLAGYNITCQLNNNVTNQWYPLWHTTGTPTENDLLREYFSYNGKFEMVYTDGDGLMRGFIQRPQNAWHNTYLPYYAWNFKYEGDKCTFSMSMKYPDEFSGGRAIFMRSEE